MHLSKLFFIAYFWFGVCSAPLILHSENDFPTQFTQIAKLAPLTPLTQNEHEYAIFTVLIQRAHTHLNKLSESENGLNAALKNWWALLGISDGRVASVLKMNCLETIKDLLSHILTVVTVDLASGAEKSNLSSYFCNTKWRELCSNAGPYLITAALYTTIKTVEEKVENNCTLKKILLARLLQEYKLFWATNDEEKIIGLIEENLYNNQSVALDKIFKSLYRTFPDENTDYTCIPPFAVKFPSKVAHAQTIEAVNTLISNYHCSMVEPEGSILSDQLLIENM